MQLKYILTNKNFYHLNWLQLVFYSGFGNSSQNDTDL